MIEKPPPQPPPQSPCRHEPCKWPRCDCPVDIVWTKAYLHIPWLKRGRR